MRLVAGILSVLLLVGFAAVVPRSTPVVGVLRLQRKQGATGSRFTSRSTSQPAPIALWSDSSSLYWSGALSSASGMVHSNSSMTFAGAGISLNGPVEYATSLGIVGAKPSFSEPPSKVAPYGPTMNYNLGLYAPGGEQALSAGSSYFNETATCSSSHGTWFVWGSLSPGLYWVPCNVVFLGVAQSMKITLVATGTISVVGAFERFSSYMDNLMLATTASSPLALTLTGAGVSTKGYLWDPSGGVWLTGAGDSLVCGAIGAGIIVTGLGLSIDGTSCPVIPPVVVSKPAYHAFPAPIYVNAGSLPVAPTSPATAATRSLVITAKPAPRFTKAPTPMQGVPIVGWRPQSGPAPAIGYQGPWTSFSSEASLPETPRTPPDPVVATDGCTIAEVTNDLLQTMPNPNNSGGCSGSGVTSPIDLNHLFSKLFKAETYGLWGSLGGRCNAFSDPRLYYDSTNKMWFLSGELYGMCTNGYVPFQYYGVVLGVAQHLGGEWSTFLIDQNTTGLTQSTFYKCVFDQPGMSVTSSDVIITFAVIQGAYGCIPSTGSPPAIITFNDQMWVLGTADLVAAENDPAQGMCALSAEYSTTCKSVQVLCGNKNNCDHALPVPDSPYIVYNDSGASGAQPFFGLMAITGTPDTNSVTVTTNVTPDKVIPHAPGAFGIPLVACSSLSTGQSCATTAPPRSAYGAGSSFTIGTMYQRVETAAYQASPYPGASGDIWVSGNTGCAPGGPGAPVVACAYLFRISIGSFVPGTSSVLGEGISATMPQQFLIGSPGVSFIYPGVVLDRTCQVHIFANNTYYCPWNLFVSMTEAGAGAINTTNLHPLVSSYPSSVVATVPGDTYGALPAPCWDMNKYYNWCGLSMVTLQPGLENDGTNWTGSAGCPIAYGDRWGDYQAGFPDPDNGQFVWVVSENVVSSKPPLGTCTAADGIKTVLYGWSTTVAEVSLLQGAPPSKGLWMATSRGDVVTYGQAANVGSNAGSVVSLNKPIVGMAATPDGGGYWTVASDGGIFAYGDAAFYGSMGGQSLNKPMVGIAATPDGKGYWTVASDGGVFAYGDAVFHGSMGSKHLNAPIVGMAATSDGGGYWLVASDGGIFSFGDAVFHGSMGGQPLSAPIVGIASSGNGCGYWLAGANGSVYAFFGCGYSATATSTAMSGVVSIVSPNSDGGACYYLVGSNGGIYVAGLNSWCQFYASLPLSWLPFLRGGNPLYLLSPDNPIVGAAAE